MTVGLVDFDSNVGRILVLLNTNGVCVTDSATENNKRENGYGVCPFILRLGVEPKHFFAALKLNDHIIFEWETITCSLHPIIFMNGESTWNRNVAL